MPFIGTRKYPKGPDLKRLEHHRITASGTEVDFLAPKHNNGGIPANPVKPVIMNLYEAGLFGRYDEQDLAEPPSTRLNSSHVKISYAVFCVKKKRKQQPTICGKEVRA